MTNDQREVIDFATRQRAQIEAIEQTARAGFGSGNGSGPHMPDMERLGQVEGEMRGVKQAQSILLGAVGIVLALLLGIGLFTLNKIERLTEQTAAIPATIRSDLMNLTKTLAESITAAKQTPPQLILMPAPQLPQPQPTPPPTKQ